MKRQKLPNRRERRKLERAETRTNVDKFSHERRQPQIQPRTQKQAEYLEAIRTCAQVIGTGVAGTGKTYIPAVVAADRLRNGDVDKVIISRPNVPASRTLGLLPGTLEDKFLPWLTPITETMKERMGAGAFDCAMKGGQIEIVPMELLRGRSFANAMILIDEAQNLTVPEAVLLMTRIGEDCSVVITGDVRQTDHRERSGLSVLIHVAKAHMLPVRVVEFGIDDIVRSDICAQWLRAFIREGL